MSQPFARSMAVFAAMVAAMKAGLSTSGFTYESRGKGRGNKPSPKYGKSSGRAYPFSSDRQNARHTKTQTTRIVNGFELMQTVSSADRI